MSDIVLAQPTGVVTTAKVGTFVETEFMEWILGRRPVPYFSDVGYLDHCLLKNAHTLIKMKARGIATSGLSDSFVRALRASFARYYASWQEAGDPPIGDTLGVRLLRATANVIVDVPLPVYILACFVRMKLDSSRPSVNSHTVGLYLTQVFDLFIAECQTAHMTRYRMQFTLQMYERSDEGKLQLFYLVDPTGVQTGRRT